jgi:hypothetical protein
MADNASAGATPAAACATPVQTTPVSPAADPVTPASATDDTAALGDPGKAAIDRMKAERDAATRAQKAAEKALTDLQNASATDADKAIAKAKADGVAEVSGKYQALIRNAVVRAELAGSGINASVMDLAVMAPEFQKLTVSDDGEVEGLKDAIAIFKGSRADLFKPATVDGSSGLGTGSATRTAAGKTFTRDQLRNPEFYQANKADIIAAAQEGRITG